MRFLLFLELTFVSQVMMMSPTALDGGQRRKGIAMSRPAPARVTYQVIGMMKTKSGAT
ncbi:MAG: hypothetical protein IID33_01630 [Planctomycetes bacterium]|nr:hypothetical protein [Planctomycetota bacterium]